jgi:uncharacterized protein YodC (DUF2158 family)
MIFTINPWTKVRLKSGGPDMMATSCTKTAEGRVYLTCKWNDNEHQLHMADFTLETLEVIT